MRTFTSIVCTALVVVAIGSGTPAHADTKFPPGPCRTFTAASVDRLFGLDSTAVLKKHLTIQRQGKKTQADTCRVRSGTHQLLVRTSFSQESVTGPYTFYKRPKLGVGGMIGVSSVKTFPQSIALFEVNNVYFADTDNAILKHKGRKLYTFARAQAKAFAARK